MKLTKLKLDLLEARIRESQGEIGQPAPSIDPLMDRAISDVATFLNYYRAGRIRDCKLLSKDEKNAAMSLGGCLRSDEAIQPSVTVMAFIRAVSAKVALCRGVRIDDEILPVAATY